jgi:hypothetical protein
MSTCRKLKRTNAACTGALLRGLRTTEQTSVQLPALNTRLRGHVTTSATTDTPTSTGPAGSEHRSSDGGGDQSEASSSLPAGSAAHHHSGAGGHSSPPPPSGGGGGAGSTFFLRLREGFIRGSSTGQHVADTRFLPPFATVCACRVCLSCVSCVGGQGLTPVLMGSSGTEDEVIEDDDEEDYDNRRKRRRTAAGIPDDEDIISDDECVTTRTRTRRTARAEMK